MTLLHLSTDQALAAHLHWCCTTSGQNGWQAALICDIQADPDASAFAAQTAAWIANNKLPQLKASPG